MSTPPARPSSSASAGRSSRRRRSRRRALALLALAAAGLGGCRSPGVIFPEPDAALRWPLPPDTPRIRYLGQIRTDRDLKPGSSFFGAVGRTIFGSEPAREMTSPQAVCTDGDSRLFVADAGARLIHVFDLDSRRYERWAAPETFPFQTPVALAWTGRRETARLLVADSTAAVVFAFDGRGRFLGTLGDNRLKRPSGIAADETRGRIYVADTAAHQIVVFTPDDVELARIGARGNQPGQFNFPTYLALDDAGRLYVSDSLNFRVQILGVEFQPLLQIGRQGDMPGYFSQPKGLTVDRRGHLWVVDAHFEAVQIFDTRRDGALLMAFGREGRGPGEFWIPAGIHADGKGRIWIADSYNRRVQVFEYIQDAAPAGGGAR